MNEAALDNLNSLVGKRAWVPGIAAGMLTLSFGAEVRRMYRGEEVIGGEIALHVQCRWRLFRNDTILVGSSDYGAIEDEREAIDYIHTRLKQYFSDAPVVTAVEDLGASAFRLCLSSGVFVDAFPSQSVDDSESEFWRMFRADSDAPHFVVGP
jgi:hypothetical protein